MISLREQVRDGDSRAVRRALREADLLWRQGERLQEAVLWVERAAAFAQQQGDDARAMELASCAVELGREVRRRSGMPARSDPAWEEARRIQSSLIEVQDSWLIPVEAVAEEAAPPEGVREPQASIEIEWELSPESPGRSTLPDPRGASRARSMMSSGLEDTWFDEAPTLPRSVIPPSARDTVRPPLGSLNELTLLMEFERTEGPDVVVVPVASAAEEDNLGLQATMTALRSCPQFEDTTDEIITALLEGASTLILNEGAAVIGWDAGVVLEGELALLRRGAISHRIEAGESFSCTGSVAGTAPRIAATRGRTRIIAWDRPTLEFLLGTSPWVLDALRVRADFLATVGAIPLSSVSRHMGEAFVRMLLGASRVVVVPPHAVLFDESMEVHALNIVGAGEVVLSRAGEPGRARPGQILFADELVAGAPAPLAAKAGDRGATLLHVEAVELNRFLPHVPLLSRALADDGRAAEWLT